MYNLLRRNYREGREWVDTEHILDGIFQKFFNMDSMDVKGYRRLRTISQLIFESFPQVIIQAIFLWYAKVYENMSAGSNSEIYASIILAVLHTVIELFYLYLEFSMVKSSFIEYALVCMNGRLNWVPFIEKMQRRTPNFQPQYYFFNQVCYPKQESMNDWFIFDFDIVGNFGVRNAKGELWSIFKLEMDFQFTDETIKVLT